MFLLLLDVINEYRAGMGKENLIEIKKRENLTLVVTTVSAAYYTANTRILRPLRVRQYSG